MRSNDFAMTRSARVAVWAVFLSSAIYAPMAGAQQALTAPRVSYREPVEFPMKMRGAMPAVEVMVNGQGPFLFAVDLGSSGFGRADASLVKRLNIPVVGQAAGSDGSGGTRRGMEVVRLDSVALGSLRFEAMDVASRDYNTGTPLPPIDGILCLDLFRGFVVTLDYPAQRMRIERGGLPEADGKTVFAAEPGRRNMVVPLTVGGKTVPAVLDTGNMVGLLLPTSAVKDLPKAGEPVSTGKARTVNGEYEIMQVQLAEPVKLGGNSLGTTVRYYDQLQAGNIGSRELAAFRVSFDPENNRVRIVPSAANASSPAATSQPATQEGSRRVAVPSPQSPRRYGVQFIGGIAGDVLEVAGAEPGSPAEKGGLRAGDKILAMNGTALRELSEAQRIQGLRASPLTLRVEREGKTIEIKLSLD